MNKPLSPRRPDEKITSGVRGSIPKISASMVIEANMSIAPRILTSIRLS